MRWEGAWTDPVQAARATADDARVLLQQLVAARLVCQNRWFEATRSEQRALEREMDDHYRTATILMNLTKTERELSR